MKNTFLLLSALCLGTSVYAQDIPVNQVPSVVTNSFNRSFPKAREVEWEKKGSLYNADFEVSNIDNEVWIDAKGIIVRSKKDMTKAQLPVAVSTAIKKEYPAYRIDDVDQYVEGKQAFYKVELEKGGHDTHVVFDQAGRVSSKRFD